MARKSAKKTNEGGATSISTAALDFLGQMKLQVLMTGDETDRAKSDPQFLAQSLNVVLCGVASDRPAPTDARFKAGAEAASVMAEHFCDYYAKHKGEHASRDEEEAAAYASWLVLRKQDPITVEGPDVAPPGANLPMDKAKDATEVVSQFPGYEEPTIEEQLSDEAGRFFLETETDGQTSAPTLEIADEAQDLTKEQWGVLVDRAKDRTENQDLVPESSEPTGLEPPVESAPTEVHMLWDPETATKRNSALVLSMAPAVVEVPISYIEPSPLNPRQFFNEAAIQALATSIQRHGQTPITVRFVRNRKGVEHLEIVAGERRHRACKLLSATTMRVEIIQCDDAELVRRAMSENLDREDLDPISTAIGIEKTMQLSRPPMTQGEVGALYGLSQAVVSRLLGLLKMPAQIYNSLLEGRLPQSHGFAMLPLLNLQQEHTKGGRTNQADLCLRDLLKLGKLAEIGADGEGMSKATVEAEISKCVAMYPVPRAQNLELVIEDATPPDPPKETGAPSTSSSAPTTTEPVVPPVVEPPTAEPPVVPSSYELAVEEVAGTDGDPWGYRSLGHWTADAFFVAVSKFLGEDPDTLDGFTVEWVRFGWFKDRARTEEDGALCESDTIYVQVDGPGEGVYPVTYINFSEPPASSQTTEPTVPVVELPEPTPGRVDVSISLDSAQILHKRGFDADGAISLADTLFAARDILTPNSVALLAALKAKWDADHADQPMTLAERLESILAARCEQAEIDAQAICDGVAAVLAAEEGVNPNE